MVILSEFVHGSSSGSHDHNNNNNNNNHKQQRYDVFLSFRGLDTRNNITAHLYDAFVNADISTFLDDEEIDTGEDLKPELENAIKSARASVIVLSENYATSTWCLDELALILEQRSQSGHIVIPIFYHVEPTDVRKQQNSFKKAMAEHREKMKAETNAEKRVRWGEKIAQWIKALTEVANLKGKDVKNRIETGFIEEIVTEIRQRLGVPLSDTLPLLIGRSYSLEKITSWLTDGSSSYTADILTVLGMGGIGKTSLARYVFDLHSRAFDKSSFIEGINLRCTGNYTGLIDVQKQLYGDISKRDKLQVHDPHVYTSKIEKALACVKVFLVLDDIDTHDQLNALLGNKGFHPGSKIIITTRDTSLTERCTLFKSLSKVERKNTTLKIEGLYKTEALKLLRLHAFNCKDPKDGYEEVVEKLLKYCEGHPLALEVLGRSLYNRDIAYWEACIEILKNEIHSDIRTVLQMSFDSLPFPNDKELFKHIACFFVGRDREVSEKILKGCDINTTLGIPNLIERCLLSIGWGNRLKMHQLLQEMGKAIVREESPDPEKRSRLWCHDESIKVLKRKKGTDKVKGLVLDTRMLEKEKLCALKTDAFNNMDNLMILQLNYVQLGGSYEHFTEELRWLCMHGFPLKSISIPMENLVVLEMSYSKIESFGTCCASCDSQPLQGGQKELIGSCSKEKRILGSLKILDLSFCEQLHKFDGFYELPTLERLIVRKCISLIEIHKSFEECVELVHIDLSYCVKLKRLPTAIRKLKKVESLLLDGCNISSLVEKIPSELNDCVISVPSSLVTLSLAKNNLNNESFPMDMVGLSRLKYLCLDGNPIVSMPNCVRSLCSLEELSMFNCYSLMSVEHPPCTLKRMVVKVNPTLRLTNTLQKISFDQDMSPLNISLGVDSLFRGWSYEVEGMVKVQPLEGVEEKVLSSLGWTTNLDFLNNRRVRSFDSSQLVPDFIDDRGTEQLQIQMYYEFGIFSTIYGGQTMMMPDWSIRSQKSPISFTIPSSPRKQLRGLNFCYVHRSRSNKPKIDRGRYESINITHIFELPTIEISNVTKNRTWGYNHCIKVIGVGGEWLTYLSHWMFGMNDMEVGDQIIITIIRNGWKRTFKLIDENCGVGFVYEHEDKGKMEDEEEEDALEYYKSWNHIIGGDLSPFETTTGEYVLSHNGFRRTDNQGQLAYCGYSSSIYKEKAVESFRAFSKMKSPKTLRKGKMVAIGGHQLPGGVQGMPPNQAYSFQEASTSQVHICNDDDDDCMMTEDHKKEKMNSPKILRKEKVVDMGDRQPPRGVQGVPQSQYHSLLGASPTKLHICDDDDDDCMMAENEEKEKKESKEIKNRSCWWKMICCRC